MAADLIKSGSAHQSWAETTDRTARTEPGRQGMFARFAREIDPDGTLPADERARQIDSARRAYFQGLAHKSNQSGKRNRSTASKAAAALGLAAENPDDLAKLINAHDYLQRAYEALQADYAKLEREHKAKMAELRQERDTARKRLARARRAAQRVVDLVTEDADGS